MTEVAIIGAGQAGLALGYHLQRAGIDHVVVDAATRVGDSWRHRWDSLRLFTPARFCGLPGWAFPGAGNHYPTKDEVADYLEAYATRFSLPVRLGTRVLRLRPGYAVETDGGPLHARQVVIATGFGTPAIPAFAETLAPSVLQLHSSQYRRPSQLASGPVLVVGAGNSGLQIAQELAASHRVSLAVGTPPRSVPGQILGRSLFWWLNAAGITRATRTSRIGRKLSGGNTAIGPSLRQLAALGVTRVGRVAAARETTVHTEDGSDVTVANVIWATGYRARYPWIDLDVVRSDDGTPVHVRGVTAAPGLYFLGMPWQHTFGSALLGWVDADATFVAGHIEALRQTAAVA